MAESSFLQPHQVHTQNQYMELVHCNGEHIPAAHQEGWMLPCTSGGG